MARRSANAPLPGAKPVKGRKATADAPQAGSDGAAAFLDGQGPESPTADTVSTTTDDGAASKPRPGARILGVRQRACCGVCRR